MALSARAEVVFDLYCMKQQREAAKKSIIYADLSIASE